MMEQLDNGTNLADITAPVYFLEKPVAPEGFNVLALPLLINRDMTTILYNGKTYAVIPEEDETANEDGEKSNPERREDQKEEVVGSNGPWDGTDQSEGRDESQGYVDGFSTGYQIGADFGIRLAKENLIAKTSDIVFQMPEGLRRRIEDLTEALNKERRTVSVVEHNYSGMSNPERREDLVPGEDASDDILDGYDLVVRPHNANFEGLALAMVYERYLQDGHTPSDWKPASTEHVYPLRLAREALLRVLAGGGRVTVPSSEPETDGPRSDRSVLK